MPTRVLAFGTASPQGHRLVRLAFMDEAGTSRREPFVVVAAVMIHADTQLIPVEECLEELVEKHIPEGDRDGFVFHATNIWSAVGSWCRVLDVQHRNREGHARSVAR